MRDLLERKIARARSHEPDHRHYDQHCGCDEHKHTGCAEFLQDACDQKGGEDCRKTAPGIDEAHRGCSNAGREKFGLVGVIAVGHNIARKRQTHTHCDEERLRRHLAK